MYACSMLWLRRVVLGAAFAVWVAAPAQHASQSKPAAVQDLVLGNWDLNLAKSKFSPGPAPKMQRRTYEAHPIGVKATIRTIYADGHSASVQYTANYDSVEYPVTGSPDSDTITLKKVDEYMAEATLGHAGKVMGTAQRVISKDGKTMTITYKGMSDGRTVNNVAVYAKEEK